jgi:lysophospholipase L1-like esterase
MMLTLSGAMDKRAATGGLAQATGGRVRAMARAACATITTRVRICAMHGSFGTGRNMMRLFSAFLMMAIATAGHAAEKPVVVAPKAVAPAIIPGDRFAREIEALSHRDLAPAAVQGSTLFVGSSSIRLWDVAHSFPSIVAVNRGFGGATTPDVLRYYPAVIARYRPASIVVYVGENDIAAGAAPRAVSADVLSLLGKLRADYPAARIVYLSMKPSPARWNLWNRMAQVNAAVQAQSLGRSFDYLDVSSAIVAADGTPDRQYFGPDGLHMNATGYARWAVLVNAYLAAPVTAK